MASRTPPRFVPTLTEVVHSGPAPLAPAGNVAVSQEQIAQRVLQRVDLVLERRLREAIASVVLEQSRLLTPMLRERLEVVVREVVAEAVADEMQARAPRGP
ncbi:hypothetical protein [Ramlibacter pallidus]|uniref:DUF2486 family protein n=1 Tax=Ramlibacter pallidus TaxID=2780087 RepID=A0ABR9S4T2_9BURK|nr:hypothetical protein [Ramlibacter pallidus]MBE7368317.1 hypothetical protein [Ramlibacter pallidus]